MFIDINNLEGSIPIITEYYIKIADNSSNLNSKEFYVKSKVIEHIHPYILNSSNPFKKYGITFHAEDDVQRDVEGIDIVGIYKGKELMYIDLKCPDTYDNAYIQVNKILDNKNKSTHYMWMTGICIYVVSKKQLKNIVHMHKDKIKNERIYIKDIGGFESLNPNVISIEEDYLKILDKACNIVNKILKNHYNHIIRNDISRETKLKWINMPFDKRRYSFDDKNLNNDYYFKEYEDVCINCVKNIIETGRYLKVNEHIIKLHKFNYKNYNVIPCYIVNQFGVY